MPVHPNQLKPSRASIIQSHRRPSCHPRSRRLGNPDQHRRRERYQQSTLIKGTLFDAMEFHSSAD